MLTVPRAVEEVLLVFSFVEEAESFLWFAMTGGGQRVRESRCGELASVLCAPCAGVRAVALDPLPRRTLGDGTAVLFGVERKRFLGRNLARERRTAPKQPTRA